MIVHANRPRAIWTLARSVMPRRFTLLTSAAALLVCAVAPAQAGNEKPKAPAPVADHHMHIQSALISSWLREIKAKIPAVFDGISDDIFTERSGADAVRELDRAGIRQGVLLSTGYMFGFPAIPLEPAEMARRMREENRFNVDAALASRGRLVAFVGINPFAPNAQDELSYWSHRPGASGVKLHLGNSQFDPASTDQVTKLAAFFAEANKARMPLVVHLRGEADFSAAKVRIFIDKVLSQAGDLPVQIAHGGGYGGLDQPTLDALAAYGDAIARKAPGTRNLVFDISAILHTIPGSPDGGNKKLAAERAAAYVALMRKIGLEHFVLASDWPAIHPPAEYFASEQSQLPVTAAEWAELCKNRAPYLRPEWTRKLRGWKKR